MQSRRQGMKRGIVSVMLMAAACVVVAIPDCVQGEELAMAADPEPRPVSIGTLPPGSTIKPTVKPMTKPLITSTPTTRPVDEPIPILDTTATEETPVSLHESLGDSPESPAVATPVDETKAPSVVKKATVITKQTIGSGSSSGSSSGGSTTSKLTISSTTNSGSSGSSASASASGSEGSELSYACACKTVRKVSLMGASDYCLSPNAAVGNKCGNVALGEKGECPTMGAQPCQDTGHVLTNNSMCAYDKRDDVYKCVASTEDLLIQKRGGKVPKKRSSSNKTSSTTSTSAATGKSTSLTRVVVGIACLIVGIASVV